MPNIKKTHKIIISTFIIPHIDWAKDDNMIFISVFLETILKGLKVRNSLKILRSTEVTDISTIDIQTIRKSSLDQLSFRYAFYPTINPREIILSTLSQMKMQLKAISTFLKITPNYESLLT